MPSSVISIRRESCRIINKLAQLLKHSEPIKSFLMNSAFNLRLIRYPFPVLTFALKMGFRPPSMSIENLGCPSMIPKLARFLIR